MDMTSAANLILEAVWQALDDGFGAGDVQDMVAQAIETWTPEVAS